MKFAYIVHANIPDDWAHSVQIVNMCKAFAENGIDVTLVVPNRKILSRDLFQYYNIPQNFKVKKIPCVDLSVGDPHPIFYWLRLISFYISARFYIWFNKFDVLYSRDLYATLLFPGINIERHSFPKKISFLDKIIFLLAGKIIVLTSFIKEKFILAGFKSDRVLVSPDGVDLSKFDNYHDSFKMEGISKGDFVFGYIGTLKTMGMEKGVADSLRALAKLPSKFKFLVVGGEPVDVLYYQNMADMLEVSNKVVFIGKVPYSDVSKYASICNAFVAPFPGNDHYSFYMSPLKIFEYMASRRPIITTNLPSLREILINGKDALLVPAGSPEALALALERLSTDTALSDNLAQNAYLEVKEKYTWYIRARKIISFIADIGRE